MKRILFIAAHRPDRSPSQRFRFEQYFSYLEENGFECKLSYIVTESDDRYLYAKGFYFQKLWIFIKSVFKRKVDFFRALNSDIVFIQREAFMTGSTFFERLLKMSGAKIVFDFDDSIWLQDDSPVNNKLSWLKNASKTSKIIGLSDLVFAGNEYLADYARTYCDNVKIIPTTIDTNEYSPIISNHEKVVIGWSGSFSTVKHFESALPSLYKLSEKYRNRIEFKLIGDATYQNEILAIQGIAWSKKNEIAELSKIDIGIMPLPDDAWAKGKCGLKGLQYMALGIPTIMSPVGVNVDIIEDGENGFLAENEHEWVTKISKLVESQELRDTVGGKGRQTVLDLYSVDANREKYVRSFTELLTK